MNKFTKLAFAATALVLGSAAQTIAAPVITVSVSNASGTAGECALATGGAGTFSGTSCTQVATNGVIFFSGAYGTFDFEESRVVGNGDGSHPLEKAQPALWLNSFAVATSVLGTTTITAVASGYSSPADPFILLSALSGTTDGGMSQSASLFFDDSDSGVAGAGVNLLAETFTAGFGAESFNQFDVVSFTGTYSLSWIYTVTRFLDTGVSGTATFAGTLDSTPLPGPAGVGLLGLGMLAAGYVRRRKTA